MVEIRMGLLGSKDDEQKPLFRQYVKTCKKKGEQESEIYDTVREIRLSGSEEWIIVEGENSTALINAESKVGKEFWEAIQPFKGMLKGLMLVPAKGKLGFDIEPMDNVPMFWEWEEEGKLTANEEESSQVTLSQKLSLNNMKLSLNMGVVQTLATMKNLTNGIARSEDSGNITPPPKSVSKKQARHLEELTKHIKPE